MSRERAPADPLLSVPRSEARTVVVDKLSELSSIIGVVLGVSDDPGVVGCWMFNYKAEIEIIFSGD